jgi:hypothetical protein
MKLDNYRCDECGVEAPARYNGGLPMLWYSITLNAVPVSQVVHACSLPCLQTLIVDKAALAIRSPGAEPSE